MLVGSSGHKAGAAAKAQPNILWRDCQCSELWRLNVLLGLFGCKDHHVLGNLDLHHGQIPVDQQGFVMAVGPLPRVGDDPLTDAPGDCLLDSFGAQQAGELRRSVERITNGLRGPLGKPRPLPNQKVGADALLDVAVFAQAFENHLDESGRLAGIDQPQVDLAHLNYQKGRLVRSWTHLERQRGGAGFMGGPGETQIEADRRLLQERIVKLERELEQVVRTRQLHRAKRRKVPHPIVALVGYTNAGKSTLFNRITGAGVLAEDMLFATLDPTMRRVKLPHGTSVILSDTVGFISDLPTHLVAAFRATLEEVLEADLILHVRDMSDPDNAAQSADVLRILGDLGIDEKEAEQRIIEVWNKVDRLEPEAHDAIMQRAEGRSDIRAVSAITGEGVDALMDEISKRLSGVLTETTVLLSVEQLPLISWVYSNSIVDAREDHEDGSVALDVRLSEAQAAELERKLGKATIREREDWER